MIRHPTAHGQPSGRLSPGTQLNGIFEIDQYLAAGGMGEIYKGHAIETGDCVAIKVMRGGLSDDETVAALFRKEAKVLHRLQHEAIVRYYVFSRDPGIGRHYLAMEYVEGEPLSQVLRRGSITFDQVLHLRQRLADAFHEAHQRDVIHRDVSPDNILIADGDVSRAKLIDFGIAPRQAHRFRHRALDAGGRHHGHRQRLCR
jgi:serine/threonine-protein kinase